MAVRGGPTRRVPGNPMAGVLRDLQRSARTMRRRPPGGDPADPPTPAPVAAPKRPPALWAGPAAAVVLTDELGQVRWQFPQPFATPPVIGAVAVAQAAYGGGEAYVVMVEGVGRDAVSVQVMRIGAGSVSYAGPGIPVHLTAVPGPAAPLG